MRGGEILELKRLPLIILLTLLAIALYPLSPALAALQVKTDKDSYYPGSRMTFLISGATPNKVVMLELHDPSDNIRHVDEVTAGSNGAASSSITIPSDWPLGSYVIYAKDTYTNQVSTYQFRIIASPRVTTILITSNATRIFVGGAVNFIVTVKDQYGNVMAGVDVDLMIEGVKYTTRTTNSSGMATFTATFNTAGTFSVYAYSAGVSSDTIVITVLRAPPTLTSITLTANATSITQYQTVLFVAYALDQYGIGIPNISLDLYVGGVRVASATTDSSGRASFTYTFNNPGTFNVYVAYGAITSPTVTITVAAYIPPPRVTTVTISLDKTKINVGEYVTITVTVRDQYNNPMANRKVELYVDGVKQLEKYTDSDGRVVFTYPLSAAGSFKFKAGCEGVYSSEVTVTVEAPPAPPIPPSYYSIIIPVVVLLVILLIIFILSRML